VPCYTAHLDRDIDKESVSCGMERAPRVEARETHLVLGRCGYPRVALSVGRMMIQITHGVSGVGYLHGDQYVPARL
jgi:hypothetical protein